MKYDFDTIVNRRGTTSLKWDVAEHELPMWVADMDFKAAPEILEALQDRLDHGVFGYSITPEEWYTSIINWWRERHGLVMEKDWLVFCTGVVPALSSIVRKMTTVGENVLIQTPVYNVFFNSIVNNGRNVLESPLVYDRESCSYHIDWADLEKKLADPQTTMMILCNPHNPIGKIWERETLERIGELCAKHHVLVVSDEIHCDLTEPGRGYIPFASVSETCKNNSITCIAVTKAFNLAGMQSAAVAVPDPFLRHRVWRGINTDEVGEGNAFSAEVVIAALTRGGDWLDELREYISGNRKLVGDFIAKEIPQIHLVPSEATYLLWLDCLELTGGRAGLGRFIRRETGLYVTDGVHYGESGAGFLRMNVACPRTLVEDGLQRLKTGVEVWERQKK